MALPAVLDKAITALAHSRAKMRFVLLATLIAMLALSIALMLSFSSTADRIDQKELRAQQNRVASFLANAGVTVGKQMRIQLVWTETFNAIGAGVDPDWADAYIGAYFADPLGFDASMVVNPDAVILRGWRGANYDPDLTGRTQPWIAAMLHTAEFDGAATTHRDLRGREWAFADDGSPLMRQGHAVIEWNGSPAIVAIAAVLPDSDYAKLQREPNYVVAIRTIDPAFLAQMEGALAMDRVWIASAPPSGLQTNGVRLRDPAARNLAWLHWSSNPFTDSLRQGMAPLFAFYLLFLTALVVGAALIVGTLWRAMKALSDGEARAQHLARHDAMTDLANRAGFMTGLQDMLAAEAPDQPGAPLLLAYFDIDHFKSINDTMGHDAGDLLICAVAQRMHEHLQPDDFVARIGGDEFVVVRRGTVPGADVQLGKDIMAIAAQPFAIGKQKLDISFSCGIALSPDHGAEAGELLRNADMAMYRAKRDGRNCWRAFTHQMAARVRRQLDLGQELRHAMIHGGLDVAYQPLVDVASGRMTGAEALLRWEHPDLGPIRPAEFIAVAEDSGAMIELGWWMMRRAFADHSRMQQLPVSINLSHVQLAERSFIRKLETLAREYTLDRGLITFEVTEATLQRIHGKADAILERLHRLGFKLALDNFGTGVTSIAAVRRHAFAQVKIDRSFVRDLANEVDALSVLRSIVELGHALGIQVVAEGIETPLQRQLVLAAGCRFAQGRLFWDALPPAALVELCRFWTPRSSSAAKSLTGSR